MKSVVVNIPDSVDLSKVSDVKLCIRYYKDNDEYSYVTDGFSIREERPQGEWIYGEDDCGQDGWFCSECNFFVPWYYQYYEKDIDFIRDYKVCPHCLAEMVTYTGKDRDTKGGEK